MKPIQHTFNFVIFLLVSSVLVMGYVIYKDYNQVVINLPEEIELVDKSDNMKLYYSKNRDTLYVEYNNSALVDSSFNLPPQGKGHICFDSTHLSCDGELGKRSLGCSCDGLGCSLDKRSLDKRSLNKRSLDKRSLDNTPNPIHLDSNNHLHSIPDKEL